MNLLIVDDEAVALQALRKAVKWPEYGICGAVYEARDSSEAMEVLSSKEVDILLCDIEMPGDSGIELVMKMREAGTDISIVFMTCHAKFEYAHEALRLGCDDYILTPASYSDIAEAVSKAAQKLKASREGKQMQRYGEQWLHEKKELIQSERVALTNAEIADDICAYVLANLSDSKLSVKQLAERHFLHEDYVTRIFKREKGISIKRFIINERMELAKRLLDS
ncbi:MAG: response regulator, partial [Clostridiales bacterium]|nr:response regulator [Clostridiales bacterium]